MKPHGKLYEMLGPSIPLNEVYSHLEAVDFKEETIGSKEVIKISLYKNYIIGNVLFQFNITDTLRFTFNQKFGVIIDNLISDQKHYIDLNIFNSQKQVDLFVVNIDGKVFISI